jgi:hypothetical protein
MRNQVLAPQAQESLPGRQIGDRASAKLSRRHFGSWVFLSLVLAVMGMLSASAAQAAGCPNEQFREGASAGLPECRAYELVSPADKNGGDILTGQQASADGDHVAFYSPSGFGGALANYNVNSFRADRTSSGWTTTPMVPAAGYPNLAFAGGYSGADFSEDLSEGILNTTNVKQEPGITNIYAIGVDGTARWITAPTLPGVTPAPKYYVGRSTDASHIIFESEEPFLAGTPAGIRQIWEWVNGTVRLVSVLPNGEPVTNPVFVGTGVDGTGSGSQFTGTLFDPTAVSSDGQRIFFGYEANLFVREGGTQTRELSLSQRAGSVGDPSSSTVRFAGAATDGSRVYFISEDQLTDDATPGGGMYVYDLRPGGGLSFVSTGATEPSGAQVQAVSLVSRNGSDVYFVAQGQLEAGKGVAGGQNLYAAGPSGVHFIATLGPDDRTDWDTVTPTKTVRASADGRRFVFESDQQLTAFDNAGHREIYLYDDTEPSAALQCVSCGPVGHIASGDASMVGNPFEPALGEPANGGSEFGRPRVITDDGSRIFFETTDPLLPQDDNDREDVYEYHDGETTLISAGTGGYDSEIAEITPDGSDVFFVTRDSLVGWDIDGGAKDLYDARIDGGFPEPVTPQACVSDGCQPPATPPPAARSPLSVITRGPASATARQLPRFVVLPIAAAASTSAVKTGKLTLAVSVGAAGSLTVNGKATYGNRRVVSVKSVKKTVENARTLHLQLAFPAAVRSQLKQHHRVTLSLDVTYSKAPRPVRVTLALR